MDRSLRLMLAGLCLAICCGSAVPAAMQQTDPSQVLLLNLIRRSDRVRVYKRDPRDGARWSKKPALVVKEKSDPELLRALRAASPDKPVGLRLENAPWRFDFSLGRGKPYSVACDGRMLNQRGDAAVTLPQSWRDRLK